MSAKDNAAIVRELDDLTGQDAHTLARKSAKGAKPKASPRRERASANAAKPAAPKPDALTSDDWRRVRDSSDSEIAAAAKLVVNPKRKDGLYCVFPCVYIRKEDIQAFTSARHKASVDCEFKAKHFAAVARAEIEDAYGNEEAALTALGLLYHTDRGDGFVYVRAFRAASVYADWKAACAAAHVETRCRPC